MDRLNAGRCFTANKQVGLHGRLVSPRHGLLSALRKGRLSPSCDNNRNVRNENKSLVLKPREQSIEVQKLLQKHLSEEDTVLTLTIENCLNDVNSGAERQSGHEVGVTTDNGLGGQEKWSGTVRRSPSRGPECVNTDRNQVCVKSDLCKYLRHGRCNSRRWRRQQVPLDNLPEEELPDLDDSAAQDEQTVRVKKKMKIPKVYDSLCSETSGDEELLPASSFCGKEFDSIPASSVIWTDVTSKEDKTANLGQRDYLVNNCYSGLQRKAGDCGNVMRTGELQKRTHDAQRQTIQTNPTNPYHRNLERSSAANSFNSVERIWDVTDNIPPISFHKRRENKQLVAPRSNMPFKSPPAQLLDKTANKNLQRSSGTEVATSHPLALIDLNKPLSVQEKVEMYRAKLPKNMGVGPNKDHQMNCPFKNSSKSVDALCKKDLDVNRDGRGNKNSYNRASADGTRKKTLFGCLGNEQYGSNYCLSFESERELESILASEDTWSVSQVTTEDYSEVELSVPRERRGKSDQYPCYRVQLCQERLRQILIEMSKKKTEPRKEAVGMVSGRMEDVDEDQGTSRISVTDRSFVNWTTKVSRADAECFSLMGNSSTSRICNKGDTIIWTVEDDDDFDNKMEDEVDDLRPWSSIPRKWKPERQAVKCTRNFKRSKGEQRETGASQNACDIDGYERKPGYSDNRKHDASVSKQIPTCSYSFKQSDTFDDDVDNLNQSHEVDHLFKMPTITKRVRRPIQNSCLTKTDPNNITKLQQSSCLVDPDSRNSSKSIQVDLPPKPKDYLKKEEIPSLCQSVLHKWRESRDSGGSIDEEDYERLYSSRTSRQSYTRIPNQKHGKRIKSKRTKPNWKSSSRKQKKGFGFCRSSRQLSKPKQRPRKKSQARRCKKFEFHKIWSSKQSSSESVSSFSDDRSTSSVGIHSDESGGRRIRRARLLHRVLPLLKMVRTKKTGRHEFFSGSQSVSRTKKIKYLDRNTKVSPVVRLVDIFAKEKKLCHEAAKKETTLVSVEKLKKTDYDLGCYRTDVTTACIGVENTANNETVDEQRNSSKSSSVEFDNIISFDSASNDEERQIESLLKVCPEGEASSGKEEETVTSLRPLTDELSTSVKRTGTEEGEEEDADPSIDMPPRVKSSELQGNIRQLDQEDPHGGMTHHKQPVLSKNFDENKVNNSELICGTSKQISENNSTISYENNDDLSLFAEDVEDDSSLFEEVGDESDSPAECEDQCAESLTSDTSKVHMPLVKDRDQEDKNDALDRPSSKFSHSEDYQNIIVAFEEELHRQLFNQIGEVDNMTLPMVETEFSEIVTGFYPQVSGIELDQTNEAINAKTFPKRLQQPHPYSEQNGLSDEVGHLLCHREQAPVCYMTNRESDHAENLVQNMTGDQGLEDDDIPSTELGRWMDLPDDNKCINPSFEQDACFDGDVFGSHFNMNCTQNVFLDINNSYFEEGDNVLQNASEFNSQGHPYQSKEEITDVFDSEVGCQAYALFSTDSGTEHMVSTLGEKEEISSNVWTFTEKNAEPYYVTLNDEYKEGSGVLSSTESARKKDGSKALQECMEEEEDISYKALKTTAKVINVLLKSRVWEKLLGKKVLRSAPSQKKYRIYAGAVTRLRSRRRGRKTKPRFNCSKQHKDALPDQDVNGFQETELESGVEMTDLAGKKNSNRKERSEFNFVNGVKTSAKEGSVDSDEEFNPSANCEVDAGSFEAQILFENETLTPIRSPTSSSETGMGAQLAIMPANKETDAVLSGKGVDHICSDVTSSKAGIIENRRDQAETLETSELPSRASGEISASSIICASNGESECSGKEAVETAGKGQQIKTTDETNSEKASEHRVNGQLESSGVSQCQTENSNSVGGTQERGIDGQITFGLDILVPEPNEKMKRIIDMHQQATTGNMDGILGTHETEAAGNVNGLLVMHKFEAASEMSRNADVHEPETETLGNIDVSVDVNKPETIGKTDNIIGRPSPRTIGEVDGIVDMHEPETVAEMIETIDMQEHKSTAEMFRTADTYKPETTRKMDIVVGLHEPGLDVNEEVDKHGPGAIVEMNEIVGIGPEVVNEILVNRIVDVCESEIVPETNGITDTHGPGITVEENGEVVNEILVNRIVDVCESVIVPETNGIMAMHGPRTTVEENGEVVNEILVNRIVDVCESEIVPETNGIMDTHGPGTAVEENGIIDIHETITEVNGIVDRHGPETITEMSRNADMHRHRTVTEINGITDMHLPEIVADRNGIEAMQGSETVVERNEVVDTQRYRTGEQVYRIIDMHGCEIIVGGNEIGGMHGAGTVEEGNGITDLHEPESIVTVTENRGIHEPQSIVGINGIVHMHGSATVAERHRNVDMKEPETILEVKGSAGMHGHESIEKVEGIVSIDENNHKPGTKSRLHVIMTRRRSKLEKSLVLDVSVLQKKEVPKRRVMSDMIAEVGIIDSSTPVDIAENKMKTTAKALKLKLTAGSPNLKTVLKNNDKKAGRNKRTKMIRNTRTKRSGVAGLNLEMSKKLDAVSITSVCSELSRNMYSEKEAGQTEQRQDQSTLTQENKSKCLARSTCKQMYYRRTRDCRKSSKTVIHTFSRASGDSTQMEKKRHRSLSKVELRKVNSDPSLDTVSTRRNRKIIPTARNSVMKNGKKVAPAKCLSKQAASSEALTKSAADIVSKKNNLTEKNTVLSPHLQSGRKNYPRRRKGCKQVQPEVEEPIECGSELLMKTDVNFASVLSCTGNTSASKVGITDNSSLGTVGIVTRGMEKSSRLRSPKRTRLKKGNISGENLRSPKSENQSLTEVSKKTLRDGFGPDSEGAAVQAINGKLDLHNQGACVGHQKRTSHKARCGMGTFVGNSDANVQISTKPDTSRGKQTAIGTRKTFKRQSCISCRDNRNEGMNCALRRKSRKNVTRAWLKQRPGMKEAKTASQKKMSKTGSKLCDRDSMASCSADISKEPSDKVCHVKTRVQESKGTRISPKYQEQVKSDVKKRGQRNRDSRCTRNCRKFQVKSDFKNKAQEDNIKRNMGNCQEGQFKSGSKQVNLEDCDDSEVENLIENSKRVADCLRKQSRKVINNAKGLKTTETGDMRRFSRNDAKKQGGHVPDKQESKSTINESEKEEQTRTEVLDRMRRLSTMENNQSNVVSADAPEVPIMSVQNGTNVHNLGSSLYTGKSSFESKSLQSRRSKKAVKACSVASFHESSSPGVCTRQRCRMEAFNNMSSSTRKEEVLKPDCLLCETVEETEKVLNNNCNISLNDGPHISSSDGPSVLNGRYPNCGSVGLHEEANGTIGMKEYTSGIQVNSTPLESCVNVPEAVDKDVCLDRFTRLDSVRKPGEETRELLDTGGHVLSCSSNLSDGPEHSCLTDITRKRINFEGKIDHVNTCSEESITRHQVNSSYDMIEGGNGQVWDINSQQKTNVSFISEVSDHSLLQKVKKHSKSRRSLIKKTRLESKGKNKINYKIKTDIVNKVNGDETREIVNEVNIEGLRESWNSDGCEETSNVSNKSDCEVINNGNEGNNEGTTDSGNKDDEGKTNNGNQANASKNGNEVHEQISDHGNKINDEESVGNLKSGNNEGTLDLWNGVGDEVNNDNWNEVNDKSTTSKNVCEDDVGTTVRNRDGFHDEGTTNSGDEVNEVTTDKNVNEAGREGTINSRNEVSDQEMTDNVNEVNDEGTIGKNVSKDEVGTTVSSRNEFHDEGTSDSGNEITEGLSDTRNEAGVKGTVDKRNSVSDQEMTDNGVEANDENTDRNINWVIDERNTVNVNKNHTEEMTDKWNKSDVDGYISNLKRTTDNSDGVVEEEMVDNGNRVPEEKVNYNLNSVNDEETVNKEVETTDNRNKVNGRATDKTGYEVNEGKTCNGYEVNKRANYNNGSEANEGKTYNGNEVNEVEAVDSNLAVQKRPSARSAAKDAVWKNRARLDRRLGILSEERLKGLLNTRNVTGLHGCQSPDSSKMPIKKTTCGRQKEKVKGIKKKIQNSIKVLRNKALLKQVKKKSLNFQAVNHKLAKLERRNEKRNIQEIDKPVVSQEIDKPVVSQEIDKPVVSEANKDRSLKSREESHNLCGRRICGVVLTRQTGELVPLNVGVLGRTQTVMQADPKRCSIPVVNMEQMLVFLTDVTSEPTAESKPEEEKKSKGGELKLQISSVSGGVQMPSDNKAEPKTPQTPHEPRTPKRAAAAKAEAKFHRDIQALDVDDDDDDDVIAVGEEKRPVPPPKPASKIQQCIVCNKVGKCKYNIVRNGDIKHLCDDNCFKKFRSSPTTYLRGTDHQADANKTPSPAAAGPVKSPPASVGGGAKATGQQVFKTCTVCQLMNIRTTKPFLNWQGLDFCGEECLGKFQGGLSASCCYCATQIAVANKAKFCWRVGNEVKQFCTSQCYNEFVKRLKLCAYCNKDLANAADSFMAPVGNQGTFKDFCSQDCLQKYEEKNSQDIEIVGVEKGVRSSKVPKGNFKCDVCRKVGPIKHEIKLEGKQNRLCSDPCFSAFQYANKLTMNTCDNCGTYCYNEGMHPQYIQFEGQQKRFCSFMCVNTFRNANKKVVSCAWCANKKSNFDMIERVDANNKYQLFCSLNCLSLYRVNLQATSNQSVTCDQCKKFVPAQYHLTMSDASVRNFCSYSCVMTFQSQFTSPSGNKQTPQNKQTGKQTTPTTPQAPTTRGSRPVTRGVTSAAQQQQQQQQQQKQTPKQKQAAKQNQSQSPASIPIISNVVSLAPQQGSQQQINLKTAPQTNATGVQAAPPQIIIQQPAPKPVKNKSLLCKPFVQTKATSCRPHTQTKEVQTEGDIEPKKFFIPVPVPIYVPTPMAMYTTPTPFPLPIPVPVPVPVFIPTTKKNGEKILKAIKKIREKIPADPLEAELLSMAEALVDKDESSDSGSEAEDLPPETASHPESPIPQEPVVAPAATSSELGEDMLQMALRMASEMSTEPVMDLEDTLEPATVKMEPPPAPTPPPQLQDDEDSEEEYKPPVRQTRSRGGGMQAPKRQRTTRSRGRAAKKPRIQPQIELEEQAPPSPQAPPPPPPDANMHLKYTYGVNAWKHWVMQKNAQLEQASKQGSGKIKTFKTDLLQCTADELNLSLCLFVKEVRKPNGDEYATDSIYYLCLGIQQYLFENGRIDNIFTDVYCEKFTECLNEVLQKYEPKLNAHGQLVCRIEEEHLWESKQLGAHSPHVLLNSLVYFNTKYFMLKTSDDHLKLSFTHIMKHWKKTPGKGVGANARSVYLRYYCPTPQPKPGDNMPKKKKEEMPVYEQVENTDNPLRCPVKLYEFYLSKCPESIRNRNDTFYLVPERSCVPDSPVWYSTQSLGIEPMTKMLNRVRLVREIQEAHLHTQPIYI